MMDNNEKITIFTEAVNAADKLAKPWRIALIATNLMWMIVCGLLIWFAYMAPIDSEQIQDFEGQTQSQHYYQSATGD